MTSTHTPGKTADTTAPLHPLLAERWSPRGFDRVADILAPGNRSWATHASALVLVAAETLTPVVVFAVGRRDTAVDLPEPLAGRERAPRTRDPLEALLLADPRRDRRVA